VNSAIVRLPALLALLCAVPAAAGPGSVDCHIHPPGSSPADPFGLIGPFASPAACEHERQRLFGPAGRCHCSADFSPGWLPAPALPPGASPLG
jgi:hypothetical protein